MRTIFPSRIYSDFVKCEIQNGYLTRTTLKNRDHERAMFEICAHKWISLDDGEYGIALMNDSKYGHNVTRNQLGITLLRSPKHPDEQADIGEHFFKYSIIPFKNGSIDLIIRKSYELNNNPMVKLGTYLAENDVFSLFSVSNIKIIVECIKEAETGEGVILRMYESSGTYNKTNITSKVNYKEVYETNMLEENKNVLFKNSNLISLDFTPFETKTLLIVF